VACNIAHLQLSRSGDPAQVSIRRANLLSKAEREQNQFSVHAYEKPSGVLDDAAVRKMNCGQTGLVFPSKAVSLPDFFLPLRAQNMRVSRH